VLFETNRTFVELLSGSHANALAEYYAENERHLEKWMPLRPDGYHTQESWRRRAREYEEEYRSGVSLRLIAFQRGDEEIAGICEFTNITRGAFQACHLGYSIGRKFENRGLMTEILRGAIDYVFQELQLHRVMANYMPENERSARVLDKLGFEKEGIARAYLNIAGKWRDHVLTAIINPRDQAG
jgi:ribosomal-protein-alanine N-acetyltransferase